MKYIDLFAGIGGFRYGLENIRPSQSGIRKRPEGDNGSKNKLVKWECVYSNEWDKYASQIYKKHYGECDTTDIRRVKEIPDHDLICAGFPCQSFSIAGKRKGFSDTRGTLFYEICRIARLHRTPYLLLENVKGLLNHDKGQTFSIILESLDELGYDCQWQVLNSKNFGVPQNRERVFIIGHLRGKNRPKVFPIGESKSNTVPGDKEKENRIADTITGRYAGRNARGTHIRTNQPNTQKRGNKSNSPNRIRRTSYSDGMRIRRLTPTECERLQGFPDGWTEGLSDTQRYKCLGNAVTTNVVTAIGKELSKGIDE